MPAAADVVVRRESTSTLGGAGAGKRGSCGREHHGSGPGEVWPWCSPISGPGRRPRCSSRRSVPPRRPAPHARHRGEGLRLHLRHLRGAPWRPARPRGRHRRRLVDGQPDPQHAAHRRHVRETLPYSLLVAGGPLPTVFPLRYTRHFDAVFRGEADLSFPRSAATTSGARSRGTLGELPLDPYHGLFVPDHGPASPTHRCTTREASWSRSRCPTAATSTTPPTRRRGCARRGRGHVDPRHAGLSFRLRLLLQARLRQGRPSPPSRRRLRRDRAASRASGYDGLWIADDTFTLSRAIWRSSAGASTPSGMSWSCLSRVDGIDAGTARRDERRGLPTGLPGPRVGQPGHAATS